MPSWFTLLYLFFNALFANGDQSRYPLTVLSDCEDLNQFGWKCQLDPAIDPTILHLQPSRMFGHPNQFYLDVDLLRRPPIEMTFMAIHVKRRFLDVQISGLEEADMQRLKRGNLKISVQYLRFETQIHQYSITRDRSLHYYMEFPVVFGDGHFVQYSNYPLGYIRLNFELEDGLPIPEHLRVQVYWIFEKRNSPLLDRPPSRNAIPLTDLTNAINQLDIEGPRT